MFAILAFCCSFSKPSCCQAMGVLAADPAFIALHEAPIQEEFKPRYGRMERIAGANDFVVPASTGSKGGVIMIHEWWGLNNQIKETAEKLHRATGYGVVAVDLYGGKVATSPQEASKMMQSVNGADAGRQLSDTIRAVLKNHALGKSVRHVGVIGYCFGGGWSLQTAIGGGSEISACVMYYGFPETDPAKLAPLRSPVIGFFGNQDTGITPILVDKFQTAMKEAGKNLEVHRYDAPHAFANPSNPHYNKEATADAWSRMVAFFKAHLG